MPPRKRVRNPQQHIYLPAETWTAVRIAALRLGYPSTSALIRTILGDWLQEKGREP